MSVAQGHRERSRFDQERPVAWIYKLLIINIIIAVIPAIPAHAQAGTADKATLLANIEGACPGAWEAVDAGFIGGADTVADAWQGNAADRDAFIAYLQAEMANESLTAEELEAMASDPMAVVAECSYQKLQFMRLMALQAADVTRTGELSTGAGTDSPALPDGRSQAYAAASCEFIGSAYPSSPSGMYWVDEDGGDTANATERLCVLGFPVAVEAEAMETRTIGGASGEGWNIWSEGYIEQSIPFAEAGTYLVEVITRGSMAGGGWPNMEVRVDQVVQHSHTVNWENWASHFVHIDVDTGDHAIAIAFTNDFYEWPNDRNLYIDKVVIHHGVADGSAQESAGSSCKQIIEHYPGLLSGVYWVDVNGAESSDGFRVYCDMEAEGGGWTLVVAQFEADQLTDWDEGIQADYDPSLASSKSFTLSSSELPAHSETAFGKSLDPTYIDYVDLVYSTADIDKTLLAGKRTSNFYHIHRHGSITYDYGDPEGTLTTSPSAYGRFTFDQTGGRFYTWSYLPAYIESWRGYGMLGRRTSNHDAFAWTVWVR